MEQKSKRMVATEVVISKVIQRLVQLKELLYRTRYYKPASEIGLQSKEAAVTNLEKEIERLEKELVSLKAQLEVETVEYLSGADTDLAPQASEEPSDSST